MSFKIVLTHERGKIYFTAVPSAWENENILKWPEDIRHSSREILRQNAESVPESSWASYKCLVKLSNIKSFQAALSLEKMISQCADSDAEEVSFTKYLEQKEKANIQNMITKDRNTILEKEFITKNNYCNVPSVQPEKEKTALIETDKEVHAYITNIVGEAPVDAFIDYNVTSADENVESVAIIQTTQIKQLLDSTEDMKNDIMCLKDDIIFLKTELVKTNVHLENIYALLRTNNAVQFENLEKNNKIDEVLSQKFPISKCEEVTLFDEKLKNENYFKIKVIDELSKIGGTGGEEVGSQILYKIIDHIFTKEALTYYSWTGISKSKDLKKQAFNCFHGIIDVIFKVIRMADNHWSLNKTEKILKEHVLKQAKKRHSRHQEKLLKNAKVINESEVAVQSENEDRENDKSADFEKEI